MASSSFSFPGISVTSQRVYDMVRAILSHQGSIERMQNGTVTFHLGTPGQDKDVKMKVDSFLSYST